MAIYHLNISSVNRAQGSNACATASYITGYKMTCVRTGEVYDYGRKQRVLDVATHLPADAPAEWNDPAALVNEIENFETKENARVAKKLEIALPREMSFGNQKTLLDDYCKLITKKGYACIVAIHNDKDNNNPHAHILIPNRPINRGQFEKCKSRKDYVRDENGNRVPIIDPQTGKQKVDSRNRKQWKRKTVKTNWIGERSTLLELRRSWAEECNKWLDESERIDHRSNEERGLATWPTKHEGYAARAIEQRGEISPICEYNREVEKVNKRLIVLLTSIERWQKHAKRVERIEQALDATDSIANAIERAMDSNAINNAIDRAMDSTSRWWRRSVVPALRDAIRPQKQQAAGHSEQWDDYQERRRNAPQATQTLEETYNTTEPKQTQQRASESHIEPIQQQEQVYDLYDKEDYDLDDILDECERESSMFEERSRRSNRYQEQDWDMEL